MISAVSLRTVQRPCVLDGRKCPHLSRSCSQELSCNIPSKCQMCHH
ncbi:hypothetical protein T05_6072 [Trichinella murrelli]|uniref:Uncharacterized protein n=1 Tax=Trichinella murrelli TaxID=144512 RepID=A0A0V0SQY0_9BILA|nr:hypothetical protein T05_6072 [Trichinella murrelli]